MLKGITGVGVGYVLFGGSAVLLFQLSGVDPHGPSSGGFRAFSIAYGIVFAVVGGYVTGRVAPLARLAYPIVLGTLIALAGLVSLIARPGEGAIWSQLASMALFGPAAALTGVLVLRGTGATPT